MRTIKRLIGTLGLMLSINAAAGVSFTPNLTQPIGHTTPFVLSKGDLADNKTKLFRAVFDNTEWWGDIESLNVNANGEVVDRDGTVLTDTLGVIIGPDNKPYTPNWSAARQLDALDFRLRKIITNTSERSAAPFVTLSDLTSAQQASLKNSQALIDFLRGDRSKEGTDYRKRTHVLGDIVQSTLLYVPYNSDPTELKGNLLFVGANDGMLHAFEADTGKERFAYIPGSVIPGLYALGDPSYEDLHQFFVNGELAYADVTFSDGSAHRVLVGGLGAGGKAFFALDITSNDFTEPTSKFLWEITANSTGMGNLGYSYSRPVIAKVWTRSGARWAVIVANGYDNGNRPAALFVLDIETGELIKEITTASSSSVPNGLSSPTAVDINGDAVVDHVYAGDLDGNVWRFDLNDTDPANWSTAFSGQPLATLKHNGVAQPVTVPPRVASYPDGGLLVLVGTGKMLMPNDPNDSHTQSLYGLRDRFDGNRITTMNTDPRTGNFVRQQQKNGQYGSVVVRTSSANPFLGQHDGWVMDLRDKGERIVSPVASRSGRLLFTTINPTATDPEDSVNYGETWVNEIDLLSGGAPDLTIFDMNGDNAANQKDNIDGNGDGDKIDPEDRISGLQLGYGIVASTPATAVLNSRSGTFLVNWQFHPQPVTPEADGGSTPVPTPTDPGLLGGHFDVDTTKLLSTALPQGSATTDGHVHQYDDKHNVKGVDYFNLLDTKLHNIDRDITNGQQKFKLIIVNADKSPGGRLVINQAYDETVPGTYTRVTSYDNNGSLIYSLGGTVGSTPLTQLGIYFDVKAILNGDLIPTQTGCVKKNIASSDGRWRNGALTIWAVKVNADGSDAFTLIKDPAGNITGIRDGLLWESTLFWHWEGPCTHEYNDLKATYVDGSGNTVTNPKTSKPYTVFEYWRDQSVSQGEKEKEHKDKHKDDEHKDDEHKDDEDKDDEDKDDEDKDDEDKDGEDMDDEDKDGEDKGKELTSIPPGWLNDTARASWNELKD